eukprot:2791303-Pleurochrysis_carterae.AAC.1
MLSFLKARFGERAANVLSVPKLWKAVGKVYNAACSAWEADTIEYREARALLNRVFNRVEQGLKLPSPIMIIPQQIVQYGNLLKHLTCATESRGALLTKFGRQAVKT